MFAGIIDGNDIRVIEFGNGLSLMQEPSTSVCADLKI